MPEHRTVGDLAYLLVGSWLVGTKWHRIPTVAGVLDRALYDVKDKLPDWAKSRLHFTDMRAGLRCPELPSILAFAQDALLTVAPNPSYRFTEIQVSEWNALDFLRDINVSREDARELGEALKEATDSILAANGPAEREPETC